MKISGIYKISSLSKPERCYVGSAVNISERWHEHLSDLRNNNHHSLKLQRHFNKYSESDLHFSIMLGCDKEDLIKIEQYFIDSYNPYFNNRKIAGSNLGLKFSEESKRKISEGKKNPSEETRRKMSKAKKGQIPWNSGKHYSEEIRRKLSKAHKGKSHSEETKLKMSVARKGKYLGEKNYYYGKHFSEETKRKMSEAKKGVKNYNYGKHFSEEHKRKISQTKKRNHENNPH